MSVNLQIYDFIGKEENLKRLNVWTVDGMSMTQSDSTKLYTKTFHIDTSGEFDFFSLKGKLNRIVKDFGIKEGICLVFSPHATGVLALTEYEPNLRKDIEILLKRLIPSGLKYYHPLNASAHLRSLFLSPSKVIPILDGKLSLGQYQSIFWIEVEQRPRRREIQVYVIGVG